ncbi:4909_t:CDS:2 [Rhizophagus irregularis]|nr:4909_t:CDS:2 [Rhizophagus irregularis]
MFRNLYRVFPSSVSASTTNTTLISLKLLKSNSNSLRRSSSSQTSSLKHSTMSAEVFYNLETPDIKKNPFNFSAWKGNVVLLVNVASKCGYTPQYSGLESLYNKYKDQGLVVAGLPCNQFGAQEPGTEEVVKKYTSSVKPEEISSDIENLIKE